MRSIRRTAGGKTNSVRVWEVLHDNVAVAAMRDGCRAAIDALHADEMLAPGWTRPKATDALWAMLLVPHWEALTIECGWSTRQYVRWMTTLAEQTLVRRTGS